MKATYNDFLKEHVNCSGLASNEDAKKVFDFLNTDETIIKMIESSEQGKPALAGCVNELEALYDAMNAPKIKFTEDFTRQAVGRMIKTILDPFGYRVTKKKDISREKKAKYFKAASCYEKLGEATMRVVKRIEMIAEN
ncbi:MAG: hypothetical protein IJ489_02345 [Clostridia bacterium]|nr:hypothetical protein [Clostridia bacterium]